MAFVTPNRPQAKSTQKMLPDDHPDRIQIAFYDHRLVANAGLLQLRWPCTWAFPNWLTGTWTWAMHQAEPTPATR